MQNPGKDVLSVMLIGYIGLSTFGAQYLWDLGHVLIQCYTELF